MHLGQEARDKEELRDESQSPVTVGEKGITDRYSTLRTMVQSPHVKASSSGDYHLNKFGVLRELATCIYRCE